MEALVDLDYAIELDPTSVEPFVWRGYTHFYLEDFTPALADLEQALQMGYNEPRIYLFVGEMYFQLERYEDPLVSYKRYLEIAAPTDSQRGAVYLRTLRLQLLIAGIEYRDLITTL